MTDISEKQKQAILMLRDAVLDTIEAAGTMGAPGGHLYAALMVHGITLDQFQKFMSALEGAGMVRQEHHCYFFVRRP